MSTAQAFSGVVYGYQALPVTATAQSATATVTLTVASLLPTVSTALAGVLLTVANSTNLYQSGTFTAATTNATTVTYACSTSATQTGSSTANLYLLTQYCNANVVPNVTGLA